MKTWFTITDKASEAAAEIDIFDEIGLWGVTPKDFAAALKAVPTDRNISLRINSPGGSVFDGFAIYNLIAERREKVVTNVIGLAGSMASIVMLAGKRVIAAENATIMIHNPMAMAWGESDEMRKMADLLDKLRGTLVNTYANKTGKKDEEIIEAMNATTWFTAKEAKDWGLVDEVSAAVKIAASFDLTRFGRVPANISGGLTSANQNQPEKVIMKNLLKALAESKLVASADVSEDTAVAQFAAAFSAQADALKDANARAEAAEKSLAEANTKLAANTKASAEAAVEAAAKAGKIKDDAAIRAKWVDAYIRDEAGTKAMLDGIEVKAASKGVPPVIQVSGNLELKNKDGSKATVDSPTAKLWSDQINNLLKK